MIDKTILLLLLAAMGTAVIPMLDEDIGQEIFH
jgi:hypothetical protein